MVDASIVAKWFLEEEYSGQALKLRDDYIGGSFQIVVPALLEYEVLNALRYSRVYSQEELKNIGLALNKYGFDTRELEGELKTKTIALALEHNITIYDASYVALAEKLNTRLYTADNELVEKFPRVAIHIKNYK